jgi:hypothetical protein
MIEPIDSALMDEEAVRMRQALHLLDHLRRDPADNMPRLDDALQAWMAAESQASMAQE